MTSRSGATTAGGGRYGLAIVGLVMLGAIVPGLIALIAGAGDIPRNDDWSYRGMALDLWSSGILKMDGASLTFAVGQIWLVQPFLMVTGGHPIAFWAFGTVAAALALVGGYLLARSYLPVAASLVAAGMLVAVPGYAAYSSSFMTDVPATAAQLFALLVAVRATRGTRWHLGWLLLAFAIGALAFSIRQFAVVTPIAIGVLAIVTWPRRASAWVAVAAGAAMIGLIALWQTSLPGQVGTLPASEGGLGRVASLVPTLGFLLLPLTLTAAMRLTPSRRALLAGVLSMGVVLLAVVASGAFAFTPGNLMGPTGVPTDGFFIGGRPRLWGAVGWLAIQVVALVATVPLVYVVALRGPAFLHDLRTGRVEPAILLFASFVVIGAGAIAIYVFRWPSIDRYLWPLIVPAAILALRSSSVEGSPSRPIVPRVVLPIGAVTSGLLLLTLSAGYATNSWAFDAARWRGGQGLTSVGYARPTIDAGYEWLGTYAPDPFVALGPVTDDQLIWYERFWPEFRPCAFLSGSTMEERGFTLDPGLAASYRLFLVLGPDVPINVHRSGSSDCTST